MSDPVKNRREPRALSNVQVCKPSVKEDLWPNWSKPLKNGAPDRIRTCGPQIRNLMLYPAELRVRRGSCSGAKGTASIGADQFAVSGGTTGTSKGIAAMPSSRR